MYNLVLFHKNIRKKMSSKYKSSIPKWILKARSLFVPYTKNCGKNSYPNHKFHQPGPVRL